jgi:hypothetical protein
MGSNSPSLALRKSTDPLGVTSFDCCDLGAADHRRRGESCDVEISHEDIINPPAVFCAGNH